MDPAAVPTSPVEEIIADVVEREGVDVGGALGSLPGRRRGAELLTEERRLALEKVTVYPEDVVLNLATDRQALSADRSDGAGRTRKWTSPPLR